MNKVLRALILVMIGVGFYHLFSYLDILAIQKFDALHIPSYFVLRSYRRLMYAGGATVITAVLGCFFSWMRSMDAPRKVLPNAISADSKEIGSWVDDSTLNTHRSNDKYPEEAAVDFSQDPGEMETVISGDDD